MTTPGRADGGDSAAVAEELRRSESRFRAAIDAVQGILWTNDAHGRMVGEQPGWARLTGQSFADYQGHGWARAVHPDDARPTVEAWNAAVAARRPFSFEHRVRRQDGVWRDFAVRAVPALAPDGTIVEWIGVHTDITDRRRAEAELRAERDRMRSYLDVADVMLLALDAAGRVQAINRKGAEILGHPEADALIGRDWFDLAIPSPARAQVRALFAAYMADEKPDSSTAEGIVRRPDGGTRRIAWRNATLRDAAGRVIGTLSSGDDVTELREAEARERLLVQEVDHRAKNLLAVVQSVVQLTRGETIADFKQAVFGRIQSLARTHGLLAATRWEGADLRQLIADELAPYAGGGDARTAIRGPALRLKPAAAQALALVVHELATNAAKYGALSRAAGRLTVGWTCANGQLRLVWRERHGPAVAAPGRAGFGSVVLRSSVERQLRGQVALDWRAAGLVCRLTLPLGEICTAASPPAPPPRARTAGATEPAATPAGSCILVVEDEALVAAQIEHVLEAAGYHVLGPAARTADGLAQIAERRPDAALLDINLGGERSFPIAEQLRARSIPFAFCSGYGEAAALPDRLGAVPMLAKPFDPAELLALVARLIRP